jgi:hypothetical protein
MGGQYTIADVWLGNYSRVPGIGFDVVTGDPMTGLFSAANFPGSSGNQRTAARQFYAALTGRVSSITGTPRLDPNTLEYVYLGDSLQQGRLPELDFYLQDSWRARPNLTINAGVRYVMQFPFRALNGSYSTATIDDVWGRSGNIPGCDPSDPTAATCNFFKPGEQPGIVPTYQNLAQGAATYTTDWNNIAPSVGVNWTPTSENALLRKVLGLTGESSISGGWSRAYERHGMSDFTGVFGANPGITAIGDRNLNNGNLGALPVLFRSSNLGPPPTCSGNAAPPACIPVAPVYPIPANTTGSINTFDPGLQVPYSDSWTIGFQRALGRSSAIEIRYVGTANRQQWTTYNLNETNIHENGFLQEFRNAQNNLYAHMASSAAAGTPCSIGDTCSFAYRGPNTGTVPLPIYFAYFVGAGNPNTGTYSGTNWTNSTHVNPLSRMSPNAFTAANALNGNADNRARAIQANYARNFFVANPDALGGANITGYGGYSDFDGLQIQFRRRLSGGLQFDASYATGAAYESNRYSFRVPRVVLRNTGGEGDVAHAGKSTFVYQLPFGQGQRYGSNVGSGMDRVVGGWQVSGTARVQTGELMDLGNIRIYGMTDDEVRNEFKMRKYSDTEIYFWPDDIIENSIKAYSRDHNGYTLGAPQGRYFAPANGPDCMETISGGYGDCGRRSFIIQGPMFWTFDLNIVKQIPLSGRQSFEVRIDMFNVFNANMFDPQTGIGGTERDDYRTDGTLLSGRVVQLVARFSF